MTIRTQLRAGANVNETVKPGKIATNHNETLRREDKRPPASMRRQIRTTSSKEDRLALLVVRAGLRAGRAARERSRGRL